MDEIRIHEDIAKINESDIIPDSLGIVYSLKVNSIYYGKTRTSLTTRKGGHNQSFRNFKQDPSKLWCMSSLVLKEAEEQNKCCEMCIEAIIPIYSDEDDKLLLEMENEYIENYDCVNNNEDGGEDGEEDGEEDGGEEDEEGEAEESIGGGGKIEIPIQIGCIYMIWDEFGVYIGSTFGPLAYRLNSHIRSAIIYNMCGKSIRVCSSHEIMLRGAFECKVLEWVVCKTKQDLLRKEREWIEKTECVNKNIPFRSTKEHKKYHNDYYASHKNDAAFIETNRKYRDANKEKIKQTHQLWNKKNAEKMRKYFKQRYQEQKSNPVYVQKRKEYKRKWNNSEKGKESNHEYNSRLEVKEHRQQMYQDKKDTETEEHKQNRIKKSKDWKSQIVICECCNKKISRGSLSEHNKTKKHIENRSKVVVAN